MNQAKFEHQFREFSEMSKIDGRFEPKCEDWFIHLNDDTDRQSADPHYLQHTAWAAHRVADFKPKLHVDFGGYIYFASIVGGFVPTIYVDIRYPDPVPFGISVTQGSIMDNRDLKDKLPERDIPFDSISCLHVLEHIGLGRYGDEVDAQGDKKAAHKLAAILEHGGQLLIAVPMEHPARVQFNAHRLYSYEMVMEMFSSLELQEFSMIHSNGDVILNCNPCELVGLKYGCGCFRFLKP